MREHDVEVYTPDEFVNLLESLNSTIVKQAFENQLKSLKNPPMSREELIESLMKSGLKKAEKYFK